MRVMIVIRNRFVRLVNDCIFVKDDTLFVNEHNK